MPSHNKQKRMIHMSNKSIIIPSADGNYATVESSQSFVIVGANGSGKSHLGAWIEKNNSNVLRISAQRALPIPDTVRITSGDGAWRKIMFGSETEQNKGYKWGWGKKETSTLVDDYESVLSKVFSNESHELRVFKDKYDKNEPPKDFKTIVERITNIWNSILPQREILLDNFEAKAKNNDDVYKAGEMSDGERVALYLIAQSLITPDDHIIVIDEPEIHLHTSIMKKLWDEIERNCPNKTFVYITHDLGFATSRKNTTKIWVKSYDGHGKWELSIIDDYDEVPDSLLLEILGTRNPVLFVEGEKNSYDIALYKEIYSNYHIVPCQNCQKVIELTKAFNSEKVRSLHSYDVKGLIDHDFLTEVEIDNYKKHNIYTIDVSEVENLYLIEPLIRIAADRLGSDGDEIFNKVSDFLFEHMDKNKLELVNAICVKEIRHALNSFSSMGKNEKDLNNDLNSMISNIDVHAIYDKAEKIISCIIAQKDYKSLIMYYNNKGLCQQVGGIIGFRKPYPQVILDLLKGDKRDEIIESIKGYLPQL